MHSKTEASLSYSLLMRRKNHQKLRVKDSNLKSHIRLQHLKSNKKAFVHQSKEKSSKSRDLGNQVLITRDSLISMVVNFQTKCSPTVTLPSISGQVRSLLKDHLLNSRLTLRDFHSIEPSRCLLEACQVSAMPKTFLCMEVNLALELV